MSKIFLLATLLVTFNSICDFQLKGADGSQIDLKNFQGKKILIVNTATHSRFASQLNSLEQLYQKYKDSLVVIAVPSNSFGNEPDSIDVVRNIMQSYYHAHYLVADRMEVNGANQSALYRWLTTLSDNGHMNSSVENDFKKYLINSDGNLIGYFMPGVDPMDSFVQKTIENKLVLR